MKPVKIKDEIKYSFVYRNATNDITKNYSAIEAIEQLKTLLQNNFLNADIFTTNMNYHIMQKKTGDVKIVQKEVSINNTEISLEHDHQKIRLIGQHKKRYLQTLGIMNATGDVKKEMQHKYKQINRYVEIVADVLRDANLQKDLHIVDMGSGKGYLTFALADYEMQQNRNTKIVGVEMRQDMVDLCNQIAKENEMHHLQFLQGTIQKTEVKGMNVLIALHACDTATDDAINKGIDANAEIIICAPCCHKQVRKAMKPNATLHSIAKHGILFEKQAEIITDSLRSLWLESKGYKTKVFDFVDVNDTPKNVMIVAIKTKRNSTELEAYQKQYIALKEMFGVEWCAVAPNL
jgi:tRNA1(Val) A37 N6-methylase TrmN6